MVYTELFFADYAADRASSALLGTTSIELLHCQTGVVFQGDLAARYGIVFSPSVPFSEHSGTWDTAPSDPAFTVTPVEPGQRQRYLAGVAFFHVYS